MQCLRRIVGRRPWLSHESSWTGTIHARCRQSRDIGEGNRQSLQITVALQFACPDRNDFPRTDSTSTRLTAAFSIPKAQLASLTGCATVRSRTRAFTQVLYGKAGIRFHLIFAPNAGYRRHCFGESRFQRPRTPESRGAYSVQHRLLPSVRPSPDASPHPPRTALAYLTVAEVLVLGQRLGHVVRLR